MSGARTPPRRPGRRKPWIDVLTGKVGRITGALVVLSGLVIAARQFWDALGFERWLGADKPPTLTSCFNAELTCPESVPHDRWQRMDLRLLGDNECGQVLNLLVKFKTSSSMATFDPPFGGSWEEKTVGLGRVEWPVTPPHISLLSDERPIPIEIHWSVYSTEDEKLIRAGKTATTIGG